MESIPWELALKPVYYIHNTTSCILVENISWELALKPGYYTIIVQYTLILSVRGITVFRAHSTLTRGRHPLPRSSAHLKSRPGKAPTYRALPSRPKSTSHVGHRVSGTSPRAGLASGKFPTQQRCLPCAPTGCLILNTQLGRVSHWT